MEYDNSGTHGRNQHRKNDKQPEFSGQAKRDGVDYWISGWVKEGKNGRFFSLSFKAKQDAPQQNTKQPLEEMQDDIPF